MIGIVATPQLAPVKSAPVWVRLAAKLIRILPRGRYRIIHYLPRPETPFVIRTPQWLGRFQYRCDLRDSISREICFTGMYEPQETAILRSLLRPGMTFVDVGANSGYFSLLAASLVGPKGKVLSLEPDPRVYRVLCEQIAANRFDQIKAVPVAATNGEGTVAMTGYVETEGNFGVSRLVTDEKTEGSFSVSCRKLDLLLDEEGTGAVDLLKMDIEGAEELALLGLSDWLGSGRIKRILLELHPRQLAERGSSCANVLARLVGHGYRGWRIDHSPAATRRAAYCAPLDAMTLLTPISEVEIEDSWPHHLWVAPGQSLVRAPDIDR